MSNEATDFLFSGGGKAFKFDNVGDVAEGEIEDCRVTQQTSMEDNAPLFWTDGSPRMQLVISLKTNLSEDEHDDGVRRLFAKGGRYEVQNGSGTSMKDAIADGVRKAGAKSLEVGGRLKVGFTGEGKKTNRGFSAPKLFKASYEPPVRSVSGNDLFGDDEHEPF